MIPVITETPPSAEPDRLNGGVPEAAMNHDDHVNIDIDPAVEVTKPVKEKENFESGNEKKAGYEKDVVRDIPIDDLEIDIIEDIPQDNNVDITAAVVDEIEVLDEIEVPDEEGTLMKEIELALDSFEVVKEIS